MQRRPAESRRAKLSGTAALDQAGVLEDAQMLGNRLDADRERLGQLGHRRLAARQPLEDRAARRIGERCECRAELIDGHVFTDEVEKPFG